MEINKDTEDKIAKLQLIEQNMQQFLMQKQNFNAQLMEIKNALKEVDETEGNSYKIIGNIMVVSNKEKLKEDLENKQEILNIRIRNIKKQEQNLKEQAEKLQKEVMGDLNFDKKQEE